MFFLFYKNPGLIGDADDSVFILKNNQSEIFFNFLIFDFDVFVLGTLYRPTTVTAVSQVACTCRGELLFFGLNFLFKTTLKSLQQYF